MDMRYCWVHAKKVYGVKAIDSAYGKGLAAARDFAIGEYIAPLGGAADPDLYPEKATGVYSYSVFVPHKFGLHKRPGQSQAFNASLTPVSKQAHPQWPVWATTKSDESLRTALRLTMASGKERIYLVPEDDYATFVRQLKDRTLARRRVPRRSRATALRQLFVGTDNDVEWAKAFNFDQFPAYLEGNKSDLKLEAMDASCLRSLGSYANDPIDLATGQAHRNRANAHIDSIALYPLAPQPSAWLRAIKNIKAGDAILVSYGPEYWSGEGNVKYGTKRVPAAPPSYPIERRGEPDVPDEPTQCTVGRRRRRRARK